MLWKLQSQSCDFKCSQFLYEGLQEAAGGGGGAVPQYLQNPDSRPGYWTQLETESFGIFLKCLETISRSKNMCEHPRRLLGCSY